MLVTTSVLVTACESSSKAPTASVGSVYVPPSTVVAPIAIESPVVLFDLSKEGVDSIHFNNWDFFYESQINIRYQGEGNMSENPLWDFFPYVGVKSEENFSYSQWKILENPPSSVHISEENEIGMYINTESFERKEIAGGGPHTIWSRLWDKTTAPKAWEKGTSLTVEFDLKMPFINYSGDMAVGQMSLVLYGVDADGKDWCYLINIYEPRGKYEPFVMYDTFVHLASSPWESNHLMTVNSGEFSDKSWEDYRNYSVTISPEHIEGAMKLINQNPDGNIVSVDSAKMRLTSVHMLLEVAYDENSSVAIGTAFKNLKVILD